MFWESSSAKSRRFPWINLLFYRCSGALCKKRIVLDAGRGAVDAQRESSATRKTRGRLG
ncbi:hypothetical protein G3N57_13755 [Paraburkholderia sp. Se-20369]|nr:hypothetical protein [Paraburkholderia sp. Se-20369]